MNTMIAVLFVLSLAMVVPSVGWSAGLDASDTPKGVYCVINEVKLFALSEEDCTKAGGAVTHTVTTTVQPADDNPDKELDAP